MLFRTSTAGVDELMERGFALLDRNSPRKALKFGKVLEGRRYSGGFELQALALEALHRRDDAILVLERGVETVPDVWILWQLLGNYRSDEGQYEAAFSAYERALALDCDPVSVGYNYANALVRAGRWEDASNRLRPLIESGAAASAEPELGFLIVDRYENVLREAGREAEADALLERHATIIARADQPRED